MAEVVEWRKEQMLPELEQMKRIRLFDPQEIDKVKKQRENFEYKLARPTRVLEDFLRYIAYERTLLSFIEERRKNRRIFEKKSNIESRITARIFSMYNQVGRRYPENIENWENFIKFCKITKQLSKTSTIWDECLKFHSDKPEMWLKAGLWEWKENKNISRAISFISRGIQRHSKCVELYMLYIRAELSGTSNLDAELKHNDSKDSDQTLSIKRAHLIYNRMKKEEIATPEIIREIESFVKKVENADQFYKAILKDLGNTVSDDSSDGEDSESEVKNEDESGLENGEDSESEVKNEDESGVENNDDSESENEKESENENESGLENGEESQSENEEESEMENGVKQSDESSSENDSDNDNISK